MLCSSLLRLENNSCNVAEAERLLKLKNKASELYLLYEKKNMYAEGKLTHEIYWKKLLLFSFYVNLKEI